MQLRDVQSEADWERMYAERGQTIKKVLREKRERSEATGCPPVGYRIVRGADGRRRVEVDPTSGPLVRDAFLLAASGRCSLAKLSLVLAERGLLSRRSAPLSKARLHGMLHDTRYTEPQGTRALLVEPALFWKAQAALQLRQKRATDAPPCS